MKKTVVFLIPALLCAGLNFSQEDPEESGPDSRYRAVEFSVTELAPVNISIKAGMDKLYAALYFSYNQFESDPSGQMFYGLGFGSIFPADRIFFFNPELIFTWGRGFQMCLAPYFGFKLHHGMAILFGPSLSWTTGKNRVPPFLKLSEYRINSRHSLSLNGRAALRLLW